MEENIFYRGNLVTNKQGEVVIITGLPEGGIYFTGVFVKVSKESYYSIGLTDLFNYRDFQQFIGEVKIVVE